MGIVPNTTATPRRRVGLTEERAAFPIPEKPTHP
jgi:hypothetical protein